MFLINFLLKEMSALQIYKAQYSTLKMNCIILRHSTAQISLGAKESSIDSYPYTERSREIQKKVVEYMMLNTGEL